MLLNKDSISGIALDSAGLVALADLSSIKQRTALMGSASYFDMLFLAPGIHTQQDCTGVNGGELPTAGDMENDYVFRIENPATVSYLQGIGEPGRLITVQVASNNLKRPSYMRYFDHLYIGGFIPSLLYFLGIALTIVCIVLLGVIRDFWAMAVLLLLLGARAINTVVVMRRSVKGWTGADEPDDQTGDLLIILSQDRWIRMHGTLDDLKAVTAGQWLRDLRPMESLAAAVAMLLVYVAAALAINGSTVGNLIVAILLLINAALLGVCNSFTKDLLMKGCKVYVTRRSEEYERRSAMVKEMIGELRPSEDKTKWVTKMDLLSAATLKKCLDNPPTPDEKPSFSRGGTLSQVPNLIV